MSKFSFSAICVLVVSLLLLTTIDQIYKDSLPKIALPVKARNTIGSIPIIEHLDDGKLEDLENEFRAKLKKSEDRYEKVEKKYARLEKKYDDWGNKGVVNKYKEKEKQYDDYYPPDNRSWVGAVTGSVVWVGRGGSFILECFLLVLQQDLVSASASGQHIYSVSGWIGDLENDLPPTMDMDSTYTNSIIL